MRTRPRLLFIIAGIIIHYLLPSSEKNGGSARGDSEEWRTQKHTQSHFAPFDTTMTAAAEPTEVAELRGDKVQGLRVRSVHIGGGGGAPNNKSTSVPGSAFGAG